jgi:hypothetical protein
MSEAKQQALAIAGWTSTKMISLKNLLVERLIIYLALLFIIVLNLVSLFGILYFKKIPTSCPGSVWLGLVIGTISA